MQKSRRSSPVLLAAQSPWQARAYICSHIPVNNLPPPLLYVPAGCISRRNPQAHFVRPQSIPSNRSLPCHCTRSLCTCSGPLPAAESEMLQERRICVLVRAVCLALPPAVHPVNVNTHSRSTQAHTASGCSWGARGMGQIHSEANTTPMQRVLHCIHARSQAKTKATKI